MHVAVVIVSYRNPLDVVACLKALSGSRHHDFEVVVCENGGQIAYEALVAAIPARLSNLQPVVAICAPSNLGYGGGVNLGMRETAHADAWWVLNPDTEPSATALSLMLDRLASNDCDAVGGTIFYPDGLVQSQGGRWRRMMARAVSLGNGLSRAQAEEHAPCVEPRLNYLSGASMLITRRFFELTGEMREDYFLYCEEVEWCLRGRERGAKFGFSQAAEVLHHQGTTTGNPADVRRQARMPVYLNERNRLLLTRDLYPQLVPTAAVLAFLLILLRFARRGAWSQVGYALQGWRAGLANERGVPDWMKS